MIALICAVILGFTSAYLWNKAPYLWVLFFVVGGFYLFTHKREVWVGGRWKEMMNFKDRLARDTTVPPSAIKAIQERYALNQEAKLDETEPPRMREIAKRLIFIDGYLAGKGQK
ncbi:hypothetical protein LCGC14_2240380 [marine sediment metagenome]|uniref:Uncharacterized protein n=1 Tax=marine sediment metagenome TaxID=412755 RepID=A0A0F9G0N2_9ZZZZ